ncbi:MerR family transcriptional regulator [Streptomyces sp. NPDC018019]|uniref:MerR family transcriptional regulator n=1 Tax=Streptomyces sp. NPDC018019 TaxID=3365030 RepID=UPI0037A79D8A
MRIGELAERAGTTTRAPRYDEARGLLQAKRTPNGHRTYGEADLRLLQQIQMLQRFGFGLEETRPFVECLRAGHPAGDSCPASLRGYRRKLTELHACIAQLQEVREQVSSQLARAEQSLHELAYASAEPGERRPRCELASSDD